MIRPRVGDYVYSEDEIDVMRRDIDAVRAAGLAGVVIGASLPSWHLDEKTIARLAEHAAGLELTLNRTVDMSPDPLAAVDLALSLGFRSILTSGGSLKAPDGVETIAAMVRRAGERLEILAGSGAQSRQCAAAYRTDRRQGRPWLLQRALAGISTKSLCVSAISRPTRARPALRRSGA